MKEFENIKDMIYCELDNISHQNNLDMNTVNVLGELVDILKDIGSIEMFEEGINIQDGEQYFGNSYNNGYSQRRMPYIYNDGNSYRRSRSYGESRQRIQHLGYSRDGSKEHMIEKLEQLMDEAQDQNDRDAIQKLINKMNSH